MAGEEGRSAQHGAADRTAVGVAAGGLVQENLQVMEGNAFIKLFDVLLGVGAVALRGQGSHLKIRASAAHVVVAGVIPVWNVGPVQRGLVKITHAKARLVKEILGRDANMVNVKFCFSSH